MILRAHNLRLSMLLNLREFTDLSMGFSTITPSCPTLYASLTSFLEDTSKLNSKRSSKREETRILQAQGGNQLPLPARFSRTSSLRKIFYHNCYLQHLYAWGLLSSISRFNPIFMNRVKSLWKTTATFPNFNTFWTWSQCLYSRRKILYSERLSERATPPKQSCWRAYTQWKFTIR